MVRSKRREKAIKACRHCRRAFEGRANADHCSERCRKADWRQRQGQARDERDRKIRGLLEEAVRLIGEDA